MDALESRDPRHDVRPRSLGWRIARWALVVVVVYVLLWLWVFVGLGGIC
jgi:hypothetical protein